MKTKTLYQNLKRFAENLGDKDFTVSVAICEGRCYISVSCHSSKKLKFNSAGLQVTAEVDGDDMDRNFNAVLNELIDKYKKLIVERHTEQETLEDAIKRTKTISSKTS